MGKKDKRVDAYIEKSAEFAKPILTHLRSLIHKACKEVEETIKWGMPSFTYHGEILCHMASFKQHCALGFWKGKLLKDPDKILRIADKNSMGHLGAIKTPDDLPSDRILLKYLKEAMKLNEEGVKITKTVSKEKKEIKVPEYLKKALAKNKKASETFNNFSYSHKKEYIQWLEEAKTEETREKRLVTALEWMEEGKGRNWKYMKK